MNSVQSFRDLRVWQGAMDFVTDLYSITSSFPAHELYGLTSQLRRAAVSVPSNIAEGHKRPSKDFARFLTMSLGSVAEIETQLEIAQRLNYLSKSEQTRLTTKLNIIGKQLSALRNSIRSTN